MDGSFLNWLKHVPWLFLSALPAAALYGFLFPWPAGDQVLSRYPDQTPVVIAFSFGSKSTKSPGTEWVTSKHETRSYVLVPSIFTNPKIVTVSQVDNHAPVVSESGAWVELIAFAAACGFAVFGLWYYWLRTPTEYRVDPEKIRAFYDHNALKADPGTNI